VVPVGKEFGVFGKTLFSKTYKNPTVVSVTKKVKPVPIKTKIGERIKGVPEIKRTKPTTITESKLVDTSGTFKFGGVSPKQVSQRGKFDPQSKTGYEPFTGSKPQTKFNIDLAKENLSKAEFEKLEIVKKATELSQKTPGKVFKPKTVEGGVPDPTIVTRLTPEMNIGLAGALRKIQSPKSWFQGKRRVDQVGGSVSQNPQLKSQFRKTDIHDVDLDVRSEKIAVRSAKEVEKAVKPFETKDIKIGLSEGRGTKVETTIRGEKDEFFEALSPKDVLEGNVEAQTSGLRFGQKYRVDKLSKITKRPIKDPVHGFKIRDIKDQTLAKASSVTSIQGTGSELFRGVPKPQHIAQVQRQEKLVASGKLTVAPPSKRTKDVVDLYNIYKSQASKLIESKSPIRKKRGKELDVLAEKFKSKYPGMDFSPSGTKGSVSISKETSYGSLISSAAKAKAPAIVPSIQSSKISLKKESSTPTPKSVSSELQQISKGSKVHKLSASSRGSKNIWQLDNELYLKPSSASSRSVRSSKNISSKSIRSTRSKSTRSKSSIRSTKSPRSITSAKSITSPKVPSPKSPRSVSGKSPTSVRSIGGSSSSISTRSASSRSVSSRVSKVSKGQGRMIGKSTSATSEKKRPIGAMIKLKDETEKKPGKKFKTHDFLGSSKTDHIVGLFRRKTVIVGDKKTNRQVTKDKKINPYGDGKSGIGGTSKRSKGLRL
jgi:hypothetical protein